MDYLDARTLRRMIIYGSHQLEKHKERINALNVFPVPDGDTGTNMFLTVKAAAEAVQEQEPGSLGEVTALLTRSSLRGARGNSGVILSQIFRGFSEGLSGLKQADTSDLARALKTAQERAYKAIMKPVEGTILTVIGDMARRAGAIAGEDGGLDAFLHGVVAVGRESVINTPSQLPALREAGVVDAGGEGLVCMFRGWLEAVVGEDSVPMTAEDPGGGGKLDLTPQGEGPQKDLPEPGTGYCTEFLLAPISGNGEELQGALEELGESLLVVGDGREFRVHIHTEHPGLVLEEALLHGELMDIKIDNMRKQHREWLESSRENAATRQEPVPSPASGIGLVAVAAGRGMEQIMRDLNVDRVVRGGQTMNPSIEQLEEAVEFLPHNRVIIFPNNSNVIPSAKQVGMICNKEVAVIPTRDMPQCISGLLQFDPKKGLRENVDAINATLEEVRTAEVTYAVRDSDVNGMRIEKGDYLGLVQGEIRLVDAIPNRVAAGLVDQMVDGDASLITVYYGRDVREQDLETLRKEIEERHPLCDLEIYSGGQPLYMYLLSVE